MRIKKFVAPTLPEALARIKQDMGGDAVILKTRFTNESENMGDKKVEVTAAIDNAANIQVSSDRLVIPPKPDVRIKYDMNSPEASETAMNSQILGELRSEIKALRKDMEKIRKTSMANGLSEAQIEISRRLMECHVPETISREIAEESPIDHSDDSALLAAWKGAAARLAAMLEPGEPIALHPDKATVVFLIGPSGAGKTSAAARIAYHHIFEKNIPVTLISADTFRADSRVQLAVMARILGCNSAFAPSPEDLAIALKGIKEGLVVIDTSGISDIRDTKRLQALIASANPHEIHLVVPADIATIDLERIIDAGDGISIDRLLITKLDQSRCRGGIISAARKPGLKFSYRCSKREIPGLFGLFDPQSFVAPLIPDFESDHKIESALEVVGW